MLWSLFRGEGELMDDEEVIEGEGRLEEDG